MSTLRPWIAPIGWLVLLQGIAALLIRFDWGFGVVRGAILAALFALLFPLRRWPPIFLLWQGPTAFVGVPRWLSVALALALAADLCAAGAASLQSLRTYQIPLDEGQTTWTAAELLRHGENPYGAGALVDRMAYMLRLPERERAGIGPNLPEPILSDAFRRYERTLDPVLHADLLPIPAGPLATRDLATGDAAREARLLGYKYGPVILMLSAPIVWLGVPAAMVASNAALCFAMLAVMWAILRRAAGAQPALAALGLLALLLDPHIVWNFMENTATDVWPLLFSALAILCFVTDRPKLMAVALAAALGCKLFPSLLFVPLLLRWRSPLPIAIFAVALAVIYGPWLISDAAGLIDNVFLWPLYTTPDDTSWLYDATPAGVALVRAIAFVAVAALIVRYLTGRESRLFWTLAVSSILLILSGRVLHNNYIPWASLWWVAAVVEKFVGAAARGRELDQTTPSGVQI